MKRNKIQYKVPFVIFSILLIFVSTSYAFASTYYVDGSCGNSGNGTTATCGTNGPWRTLSEAANGVPSGANHTISVAAGTYYENFTDSRSGVSPGYRHWVADGTVTIVTSVSSGWGINLNGSYIKFDGFKVTSSRYPATGSNYYLLLTGPSSDHNYITNCEFYESKFMLEIEGTNHLIENNDLHDWLEDVFRLFGSGHTFRGNYVHDFVPVGGFSPHADIFQTWSDTGGRIPAQDITIEKNHVFFGDDETGQLQGENGTGECFHLFMWEDSASRHASGLTIRNNIFESLGGLNSNGGHADNLEVYNNIFRSNPNLTKNYTGPGLGIFNANNVVVRNNMFLDAVRGVRYEGCTNLTNSNNLFWMGDGGSMPNTGYSGTSDKVNVNPLFTSYDNNVYNLTDAYELQSSSPAKDAGTTIATVRDDYAGLSRPQGSGYDIGAYEYTTIMTPPSPPRGLMVIP